MTARDPALARAAVGVAKTFGVPFMGLAGTCHQSAAEELGVPFIAGTRRPVSIFALTAYGASNVISPL
ncbi:hypothetical protein NUW54_g10096 [Trametes sanguinea]|uniref:Uncharacterized protein n=1 Tax=Trametes sanguinea TaxID=158606 RepID=A0ACC1P334_9APHY|nr:hypothetical protein NUW54_g10096 [Trametes sanguinea]